MADVSLRLMTKEDLPLTLAWRSNKVVYDGFYTQGRTQKPMTWEEHKKWNESRMLSDFWRMFIIVYDDRPVGVVSISMLEHWTAEIGLYIGEVTLWDKGIGKEVLKLALEYIKGYGKEYCHTTIPKNNERALRLFRSLGFAYMAEAREEEVWVTKKL